MSENKTKPTDSSVFAYIDAIASEERREDVRRLVAMMGDVTGHDPVMWGPSIVGFGGYHYRYASGREGESLRVGLSSRGKAIVLYGLLMYDIEEKQAVLSRLGSHELGKGCLYIKRLSDVNEVVLRQMIKQGFEAPHPMES
jgi:hypothetical protein